MVKIMKNLKKEYIQQVFEDLKHLKFTGIYFSGIEGKGEWKRWRPDGPLYVHDWKKNGLLTGEYKTWSDGIPDIHRWFKNGRVTDFPKDVKLKDGYILGGDGRYYKD